MDTENGWGRSFLASGDHYYSVDHRYRFDGVQWQQRPPLVAPAPVAGRVTAKDKLWIASVALLLVGSLVSYYVG